MAQFAAILLLSIFTCPIFPKDQGTDNNLAQNPNHTVCLSYEPAVVEIMGTVVRKTFNNAQDQPETYWFLELPQPICTLEDSKEPDLNYSQKDVRSVQLIFKNQSMFGTYKNLLGKKVVASGTLSAGITAHHHTGILLTVGELRKVN